MKRLTREWVRKAEGDLRAARELYAAGQRLHDAVCFHCQQAAEKYFKALLQELATRPPRTHDLVQLLDLVVPHHKELRNLRRSVRALTRYAVEYRYPGTEATARQARSALRVAEQVRDEVRARLGIRSGGRRGHQPS